MNDSAKCIHHWHIDRVGRAVCRKCGAREKFFTDIYFAMRAKYPGRKAGNQRDYASG